MRKLLQFFGLALYRDLAAMMTRAEKAEQYAIYVTDGARKAGDIVVGGDGTTLEDIRLEKDQRILIPIGVQFTNLRNVQVAG